MILDGNENDDSEAKETVRRIPHSRTDLLNKFELLKVAQDDDDEDEDSDSDIDFEGDSFGDESS